MKHTPLHFSNKSDAERWLAQNAATGWAHETTRGWIVITPLNGQMVAYIDANRGVVLEDW